MKKLLPILIVSLLSLVFLSGCGYTKPLVATDEYEINKDLLGIWLAPKEEGEEQEPKEEVGIYKFSNTEYLIIPYPDPLLFRGYEIEFKEKKYLQLEYIFPYEVEEEDYWDDKFQIAQYNLSGNNLIVKIVDVIDEENPANDINREGEDVFYEDEMYFKRCSDDCDLFQY